jgi:hypothetical protein
MPEFPEMKIKESFPEECKPIQYLYCIGNVSKSYKERIKPLNRINKLWNHIDKIHNFEVAVFINDDKFCPICKIRRIIFTLSSIRHFKHHIQKVHKIKLRP